MSKAKAAKTARKPAGAGRLIFVVDDNALLGEYAVAVLQGAGYEIKSFTDPKAVLAALKTADPKPAALVTDYEMAEMDGLELIASSRKIHPPLKTVLLSGSVEREFISQLPGKVHKFLGKPYMPAQLKDTVGDLLHP